MTPTAAIAVSGGVDSLVAAHLLKQAGHRILGLHFITGFEADQTAGPAGDPLAEAAARIRPIEAQLDAPIEIVDLRADFQKSVIDDFVSAYSQARTPNPCLVCNPAIKFGRLLTHARSRGAEFLATGHYARTAADARGGTQLLKGRDPVKDQSYFLARLSAEQLRHARFPLGEMTKADTRAIAAREGLRPLAATESQDICFMGAGDYVDFLHRQPDFRPQPGPVEDTSGRRLGTHQGLHRYTIGQRRGIGIPGPEPYYVVRLDPDDNRLVVGAEKALYRASCRVTDINWIARPDRPVRSVMARIRYRHRAVTARLKLRHEREGDLVFATPQKAVTPGQGAVFYDGERVLGGGWIAPFGGKFDDG